MVVLKNISYAFSDVHYKHNGDSVKKASTLINEIREKIDSDSRVFVAFQVNPICDTTSTDPSFESEFKKMKIDLQQDGVHIASLSTNLRNTKEIGDVSRNATSFTSSYASNKMTQQIQPLGTKSTDVKSSTPPLLIPMYLSNREMHFKLALKRALERAKQSTKNVVIIFNERYLSFNKIHQSLIECGEETILIHPNKSKNEDPTPLINYLKRPRGIYVVPDYNFVGMESHSVVFISSQNDVSMIYNDDPNSVRCNISRAVAQLTIILEIKADALGSNSIRMLYHSTDIDATFVKCQKTIKFNAFKCNSIHSKTSSTSALSSLSPILEQQQNLEASSRYVCESCIHVCHNNHKDRLYAKFGGGSFSTAFGGSRSILFGDFPRVIRNTIAGATRCCCNKITTCQLHDG